jgi:hypothetical protein
MSIETEVYRAEQVVLLAAARRLEELKFKLDPANYDDPTDYDEETFEGVKDEAEEIEWALHELVDNGLFITSQEGASGDADVSEV